jgi:hypothetical protein
MKKLTRFKEFKTQTNEGVEIPSDFETQDDQRTTDFGEAEPENTYEFEDETGYYTLKTPFLTNSQFFTITYISKTPLTSIFDQNDPLGWLSHYSTTNSTRGWIEEIINSYINGTEENPQG